VREGLAKRDALIAEGHATAARVLREAEAQQRADLSRFEQEKALIEHRIQELRSFEREYRTKLKAYIEGQLAELDVQDQQPVATSAPAISQSVPFAAATEPENNEPKPFTGFNFNN
jgi:hypothetical protein